jgi:transposase
MELTDKQWELIEPLLPEGKSGPGKKGRPRRNDREILNGILWILRTGAPWKDIPGRYPPRNTCHSRFQEWVTNKTLERILEAVARDLEERGGLDLRETFIDGSFTSAKKGGFALGQPNAARAPKSWQLSTAMVFLSPYASKVLRRMK